MEELILFFAVVFNIDWSSKRQCLPISYINKINKAIRSLAPRCFMLNHMRFDHYFSYIIISSEKRIVPGMTAISLTANVFAI